MVFLVIPLLVIRLQWSWRSHVVTWVMVHLGGSTPKERYQTFLLRCAFVAYQYKSCYNSIQWYMVEPTTKIKCCFSSSPCIFDIEIMRHTIWNPHPAHRCNCHFRHDLVQSWVLWFPEHCAWEGFITKAANILIKLCLCGVPIQGFPWYLSVIQDRTVHICQIRKFHVSCIFTIVDGTHNLSDLGKYAVWSYAFIEV